MRCGSAHSGWILTRTIGDDNMIDYLDWLAIRIAVNVQPTNERISDWLVALHFAGFPIDSIDDAVEAQMVAILWDGLAE